MLDLISFIKLALKRRDFEYFLRAYLIATNEICNQNKPPSQQIILENLVLFF